MSKKITLEGLDHFKDKENAMIAGKPESTNTATVAHDVGEYFYWKGVLHIVTAAIAVGGTIQTNTNVKPAVLADDVSDLKESVNDINSKVFVESYNTYTKNVQVTVSGIDASKKQIEISIQSGQLFSVSVIDTQNILSQTNISFYYFNENNERKSFGQAFPNNELIFTAPVNITAISVYIQSSMVLSSGNVICKLSIVSKNENSLEEKINDAVYFNELYTNKYIATEWLVGQWFNMEGTLVNNSWVAMTNQPINNSVDVIKLHDTTDNHLWFDFIALDSNWNYVGRWDGDTKTFVTDHEYKIYEESYNIKEIKELYPNYLLFLILVKDNGGMTENYTNCITVYRRKESIYSVVDASAISWQSGQYDSATGAKVNHQNSICSVDFIPPSYKYFISTTNSRIQFWSKNDEYLGIWSNINTVSSANTSYHKIINLESVRKIIPECKIKITIYDVDSDTSKADLSFMLRNDLELLKEEQEENGWYNIPNSFELNQIYSIAGQENHRIQGIGTDGAYLYIAEMTNTLSEESAETIIYKIDPTTGTEVLRSSGLVLGHANSIGYDPNNDYLLVVYTIPSNRSLLYRIKASDLTFVDTIDLTSLMSTLGSGDKYPSGISYIEDCDGFIIYSAIGYVIADATFTNVIRTIKLKYIDTLYGQNTFVRENVIYQTYWDSINTTHFWIYSYDWHGNIIDKVSIPFHLQGMVYIGDVPYFLEESTNYNVYSTTINGYDYISPAKVQAQFNLNY